MDRQLTQGMTMDEVRALLVGWRMGVAHTALLSPDRTHLYQTLDVSPPKNSDRKPVRMTFDNGRLLFWGEPTDGGPTQKSAAG